nr:uncharacterized protein LOC109741465 [Aegilops tauschii subsp. strangulata]
MRVSTEIFNLVHCDGASAADLWAALRQLFQDNVDARANNLHTELRKLVQGDAPVGVYCQCLKAIADELRELGDPIEYRQLINILLVGLNEQFEKQASFIPMMRPRPSFTERHLDTPSDDARHTVKTGARWEDFIPSSGSRRHFFFNTTQTLIDLKRSRNPPAGKVEVHSTSMSLKPLEKRQTGSGADRGLRNPIVTCGLKEKKGFLKACSASLRSTLSLPELAALK